MMELLGSTEDNIALGFVSLPLARKIRSEYFCLKLQLKEQNNGRHEDFPPGKNVWRLNHVIWISYT